MRLVFSGVKTLKKAFVSAANGSLVGLLITKGDVTDVDFDFMDELGVRYTREHVLFKSIFK